jgi:hypothetical protein
MNHKLMSRLVVQGGGYNPTYNRLKVTGKYEITQIHSLLLDINKEDKLNYLERGYRSCARIFVPKPKGLTEAICINI